MFHEEGQRRISRGGGRFIGDGGPVQLHAAGQVAHGIYRLNAEGISMATTGNTNVRW